MRQTTPPPRTTTALLLHWTMAELRYDRSSTSMRKLPTSWTADVPPPRDPCPPIATAGVPPPESRAPAAAACDDHRTLFRSHDESVITDEGADDDGVDATTVERGGPGTVLLATARTMQSPRPFSRDSFSSIASAPASSSPPPPRPGPASPDPYGRAAPPGPSRGGTRTSLSGVPKSSTLSVGAPRSTGLPASLATAVVVSVVVDVEWEERPPLVAVAV